MDEARLIEVLERARRLDEAAYRTLVELYSRRLYGFFLRMTGSRDAAEDLLQELFVRLVRVLPEYEHMGRFEPWLFRIAANLVRDRARRQNASVVQPARGSDVGSNDPLPERTHETENSTLEQAESYDQLQRALCQLSEDEKQVLMLRHFGDLSFKQIAGLLDIPLGTALARAHRGLNKLRLLMGATPRGSSAGYPQEAGTVT